MTPRYLIRAIEWTLENIVINKFIGQSYHELNLATVADYVFLTSKYHEIIKRVKLLNYYPKVYGSISRGG